MEEGIAFLLEIVVAVSAFPLTSASANSAQTYWSGSTASGAAVLEENCPIVVEGEKLVFDLRDFPSNYYEAQEDFLAYGGKVTAQYRFYNPADYTVKATLAFPFGEYPDYAELYNEETGMMDYRADIERYGVTVDGEPVPTKLRYTNFNTPFDLDELKKLRDSYIDDGFFTYDRPVTKKTYVISGIDERYTAAYVSVKISADETRTRVMMNPCSGTSVESNGIRVGTWAKNDGVLTLYVIGEALSSEPVWAVYENGGEKRRIDGNVNLVSEERMTFEDLALSEYEADCGISEIDWYNAFVEQAYLDTYSFGYASYGTVLPYRLMRWYEYEIELAPHSYLVNEVTSPMYPAIDVDYAPSLYRYCYLLSPATTWASFGSLSVEILTPYYMIECNQDGFEWTENGYVAKFSGLPSGELEFTLCASDAPEVNVYRGGCASVANSFFFAFFFTLLAMAVLVIVGVVLAVLWVKKDGRK